jgi:hypothetical protein
VLAGIVAATVVSFVLMIGVAAGPDVNPFRHHDSGAPPTLALWVFTLFPAYIMTWMFFTLFVELRGKTGVLLSALVGAGLIGAYGLFLTSFAIQHGHVISWANLLPFIVGGAVYGVTYWLVSLRRKQRRLQT